MLVRRETNNMVISATSQLEARSTKHEARSTRLIETEMAPAIPIGKRYILSVLHEHVMVQPRTRRKIQRKKDKTGVKRRASTTFFNHARFELPHRNITSKYGYFFLSSCSFHGTACANTSSSHSPSAAPPPLYGRQASRCREVSELCSTQTLSAPIRSRLQNHTADAARLFVHTPVAK